jgi:hypothetical protein
MLTGITTRTSTPREDAEPWPGGSARPVLAYLTGTLGLGVAHATFCRHFTVLTGTYFRPRAAELRKKPVPTTDAEAETIQRTMQRLRPENTGLPILSSSTRNRSAN